MHKIILTILFCFMTLTAYGAEILLKIAPGTDEDGDILVAVNDRRIQSVHAQHICHKDKVGFNEHGLRGKGTLLDVMKKNTYQYKFERINETTIKRTNLWTDEVDYLSDTPNSDGEYIDVPLYIKRRLKHKKHLIFGTPGNEYWYGGKSNLSQEKVTKVWAEIEKRTSHRKKDYAEWPFTETEKKHFLPVKMENFSDADASEYMKKEINEETGEVLGVKHKIEYWKIPSLADKVNDIRDRRKAFGGRNIVLPKAAIKQKSFEAVKR